jgi:hypothetical protein
MFVHANITHILFNMLALYFFGPRVEERLGETRSSRCTRSAESRARSFAHLRAILADHRRVGRGVRRHARLRDVLADGADLHHGHPAPPARVGRAC